MKNLLLLFVALLSIVQATAQAPQKFNYQGVARNAQGEAMANQSMALKIGILSAADAEVPDYEEIHQVKTNEFGLYTLEIGGGEAVTGTMASVRWETGNKYVRVAIDPQGGNNFDVVGTNQLLSVPYALYSDKAGVAKNVQGNTRAGSVSTSATGAGDVNFLTKFTGANTIYNSQVFDNGNNVGIGTTNPLFKLHVEKTSGTADILIRSTDPASAAAFRLRNSNNDEFGLNKFGPNATGTYMGVPRSNMAIFNNATSGGLVYNARGDMVFGNTISGVQLPRLTIKSATGNIGVGTVNPNASALMDLSSTTQGFLSPRMTNAQRNAIASPADGLVIFNTNTGCLNYRYLGNWYEWCGQAIGQISSLNCGGITHTGTLMSGGAASGSITSIPYSGGNGGNYNAITVTSSGINGLTATLNAGTLAMGNGILQFTISGTPSGIGVASFTVSIGGQTCTFSRDIVSAASVTSITCFASGPTINAGVNASGQLQVSYSGGNGASYAGTTIYSTGVTGLSATLAPGTLTNSTGLLSYNLSGMALSPGIANFDISIGGQTCNVSFPVGLAIGSYYQGGIVAYIFQPGDSNYIPGETHGIITALNDVSSAAPWGCSGTIAGAVNAATGYGVINTLSIVSACGQAGSAAKLCYDYNATQNNINYTNWFLPTVNELSMMMMNYVTIGNASIANGGSFDLNPPFVYWSSVEHPNWPGTTAWGVSHLGSQTPLDKTLLFRVRPCRYF